jgi:FkbM family methyltransferase
MSAGENSAPIPRVTAMPEPTPIPPAPPPAPEGHWLVRGLRALAAGRLPYRLQGAADRILMTIGLRYKNIRIDGLSVQVRRGSWDETAAQRVIGERDYLRPGHEIGEGFTVIDIGSNIGCFTLVAAKAACRGRVLAFEPDRENHEMTVRNAQLNGLVNVVAERAAVSGEAGTLRLFQGAQGSLHTTTPSRVAGEDGGEDVPAVTLAQIFDRHGIDRCDFLKMNCEGAEYEILYRTPPDYLRRIDRIALEYHATSEKGRVSRELAGFLVRHGFEIFEFTDFVGFDCGYIRAIRRG